MSASESFSPAIGDEAAQAATGKPWAEWFAILDAAGAADMSHQAIVAYLSQEQQVGSWWQQMLTNTYEQRIGRRSKGEMPDGFQVSVSKTVAVPVERLFAAWESAETRADWLAASGFEVIKTTPTRSLRGRWGDSKAPVSVNFTAKGAAKSQVSLQLSKLPDAGTAEQVKTLWNEALERLKQMLEQ